MLGVLLLLFVLVPFLELAILVRLGQGIGLLPTLGLVLFTGVAGAALARAQGLRTFLEFRKETAAGRLPGRQVLDGLAILVGGALLLTPGLITDALGFALLLPPTRRWIQGRVRRWLEKELRSGHVRVWTLGNVPWGGPPGPPDEPPAPGLDPRKEIRMPPEEGGRS